MTTEDLDLAQDLLGWSAVIPTVRLSFEDYQQLVERREDEAGDHMELTA